MPYQVLGSRLGAWALMRAWTCCARARSVGGSLAIFASTSLSPPPLPAFSSRTRSFIAAFSSAVNPVRFFPTAGFLLDDFGLRCLADFTALPYPAATPHRLTQNAGKGESPGLPPKHRRGRPRIPAAT